MRGEVELRFYSIDELMNAEVYDSEALFFGRVCGLTVRNGKVRLKICITAETDTIYPDYEKLRKILGVKEETSLEELVALAREKGLDIPYCRAKKKISLLKSFIEPREIKLISTAKTGQTKRTVIILNTPREARYRGRSSEQEPVLDPDLIENKLVVSLEKGILGCVKEIVVGPGEPGLRCESLEKQGEIKWLAFMRKLKDQGYKKLYEKLAEWRDPLLNRRLPLTMLGEAKRIITESNAEEVLRLLDEYVEESPLAHHDIPWSSVLKIGDIVLAK